MAGVEFRLGHNDHRVAEDFLTGPLKGGTSGIVVDAKYIKVQRQAIDAAHEAKCDVHIEPLTDRMVTAGFSVRGLDYGYEVIDPAGDLATPTARDRLVDAVGAPQSDIATAVTPPHFFVDQDLVEDMLNLNLDLVRRAVRQFGHPVRPILAIHRQVLGKPDVAGRIARRYLREGVRTLELRVSPLGGEDQGRVKVRSALQALKAMHQTPLQVVLGSQGLLGETALAMGLAAGFTVGVGYREAYNHKAAIARQKKQATNGGGGRGPQAGVYLPGPAITLPAQVGEAIYKNRQIRIRMRCPLGGCAERVDGPVYDPRRHYLHARAHDVATILERPPQWRAMLQRERLTKAIHLRHGINKYLPEGTSELQTRTLTSLLGEIEEYVSAAA